MANIIPLSKAYVQEHLSLRSGETKLGQTIHYSANLESALQRQAPKFVILGIPEDIGVRANGGKPGASNAWDSFLSAFLNQQHNHFLQGSNITILGTINTTDLMQASVDENVEHLRNLCEQLDERVANVIQSIVSAEKIPVVIGGGHNNSFGLIAGSSKALKKNINVLNLDPHADFRSKEGRHSGNGFSYAYDKGYLNRYSVLGLHESYNSEYILKQADKNFHYITYDSILRGDSTYNEALNSCLEYVKEENCGLELDLDAIAFMPSSAYSPSGFSVDEVRQFIIKASKVLSVQYLHLPEGAPTREKRESIIVGKTLAYCVSDFIKTILQKG